MPLLSAALIARDEERLLPACLASLRGVADEVVVLDTGSIDRTARIAHEAGASVHSYVWHDDFAAARNAAIGHCRGAWILYIDADERIRRGSARHLEPALRDPDALAHQVRFHVRPGFTPYRELRLFRNLPQLRFSGMIHENIWPAVLRQAAARGARIGEVELTIDHIGYEADHARKRARDLPLLQRALESDPANVYCRYQVGRIHFEQGEMEAARAALRQAIEVVRARRLVVPQDSLPYVQLAVIALQTGEPRPAPLLAEARRRFPAQPHLMWLDGRRLLDERRFAAAAARFQSLLADAGADRIDPALAHDARLFGAWPLAGLATCRMAQRRFAEAAGLFAAAARQDPHPEYRVKRALAERSAGKPG